MEALKNQRMGGEYGLHKGLRYFFGPELGETNVRLAEISGKLNETRRRVIEYSRGV